MKQLARMGRAELIGVFEDGSPEWHAARREHIGASDVPIILGLSTYKSAFTLWHEKAGLIEPAPVSEEQQRKRDYGHYMEPYVAGLFEAAHPELGGLVGTGTWRNRERPWQGCNPDRLLYADPADTTFTSLVQLKTANFLTDWEQEVPPAYMAQVKWELDTFGFDHGWLAAYFNVSGHYRDYRIDLDPFEADATRQRIRAFAESITDGDAPDIDESADTYATVRRLNPSLDRGKEVVIDEEVGYKYLTAVSAAKYSEGQLNKWRGHMLAHMGTAQYAAMPNGKRIAVRIAKGDNPPYIQEVK